MFLLLIRVLLIICYLNFCQAECLFWDYDFKCPIGSKCCWNDFDRYTCCPNEKVCCRGENCCDQGLICCGKMKNWNSKCCNPNTSFCCGEINECYDKEKYQCCNNKFSCPIDTTCCRTEKVHDFGINFIDLPICCPKYTKCCDWRLLFDYCCPFFHPLLYLPIIIVIVMIIIIIPLLVPKCNKLFILDDDDLDKPFFKNDSNYQFGTFNYYEHTILFDNIFDEKLKRYQNYRQFITAVIGIANGQFKLSSIVYLIISLLLLTLSIIGRTSIYILISSIIFTLIRFSHFILCWLEIGWIRSTYLHWMSLLFTFFTIGFAIYGLINSNFKYIIGAHDILFNILFIFVPLSLFGSIAYYPIINIQRNGNILTIELGNVLQGSNNYGTATTKNLTSIELNIDYYI